MQEILEVEFAILAKLGIEEAINITPNQSINLTGILLSISIYWLPRCDMPPKHIPLLKELRAKRCSNRSKVFFFDPEFPENPWVKGRTLES